jgi:hypothetical protein
VLLHRSARLSSFIFCLKNNFNQHYCTKHENLKPWGGTKVLIQQDGPEPQLLSTSKI